MALSCFLIVFGSPTLPQRWPDRLAIWEMSVKTVLGLPNGVNLATYDSYAALQTNPSDPVALSVEKASVEIAVLTSLSDDDTGVNLALQILNAADNGQTLNLANAQDLADILGIDITGITNKKFYPEPLKEIFDRNDNIAQASNIGGIESEWQDFLSLQDNIASTSIADLNIHVNQAPEGFATAALIDGLQGTSYVVSAADLLQGFSDPESDPMSVVGLVSDNGTVTDNLDGTFTIDLPADFNGPVELTYTVQDSFGASAPASQLFVIDASVIGNNPPTGSPSAVLSNGTEDFAYIVSAADLLLGFSDPDSDTLSVANLAASDGSVADNGDGTFTITPTQDFNGAVTLTYDVTDGIASIAATQTYTLDPVNDAPTGSAAAVLSNGTEDFAYLVSAADLLLGFSDPDSDTLSVANLAASNGSIVDNGDGTFTITPTQDFNGAVSLTYDVTDGIASIAAAQTYTLDPVNDAPTGSATAVLSNGTEDFAYLVSAADLLLGFSDPDGDTLSVANLAASNGSIVDNGDGTFTITPTQDFNSLVTLTYDVTDGIASIGASQSYSLDPVNDAPTGTATAVLGAGTQNLPYVVLASDLLLGFSDVDGDLLSVSGLIASDGSVTDNGDGTFTITPSAGFYGTVTLSYDVTDGIASVAAVGSYDLLPAGLLLTGTVKADNLVGSNGNDTIVGDKGNDTEIGNAGADSMQGDTGNDSLDGGSGNDVLFGGLGADKLRGGTGDDQLNGDDGNDTLDISDGGSDAASGGAGNDSVIAGAALDAGDSVDGGLGIDKLILDGDYSSGLVFAAATMTNIESLVLTAGHTYALALDDGNVAAGATLTVDGSTLGVSDALIFNGGAEADGLLNVTGGAGSDVLAGGGSNDRLTGGAGDDVFDLSAGGADFANGGDGNDVFVYGAAWGIGDKIDGGNGDDTLILDGDYTALTTLKVLNVEDVVLTAGHSYNLRIADTAGSLGEILQVDGSALGVGESLIFNGSKETDGQLVLFGGAGDDSLTGGDLADTLTGGDGNDSLDGHLGPDSLDGGDGNDTYVVRDAAAQITDSSGIDTIQSFLNSYALGTGFENLTFAGKGVFTGAGNELDNIITGGASSDNLNGAAGMDTLNGGGSNDTLLGGDDNDQLNGGTGNDSLDGQSGDDVLDGGAGSDILAGGDGADGLMGGTGTDILTGGAGADNLAGGTGADKFIFAAAADTAGDTIADFSHAEHDKIDVSGIDANAIVAADQAFVFIGAAGFHGVTGELHFVVTGSGIDVEGDTDGNGAADFSIAVSGVGSLVAADFIL